MKQWIFFLVQEYGPSLKKFQFRNIPKRILQTESNRVAEPQGSKQNHNRGYPDLLVWVIKKKKRIIGPSQIVWAIINLIQRNHHIVREK